MKTTKQNAFVSALAAASLATLSGADANDADQSNTHILTGTWDLVAAEVLHPDGVIETDYGEAPKGLLIVDAQGRYSLQILKGERMPVASNAKAAGTSAEYKDAVMGSSTHFGVVRANEKENTLSFEIEGASFRNWEGDTQTRSYELVDGVLSYRVPPRPNGDIPISTWKRQ